MDSKIHVATLIKIGFPSSKNKIPKNTAYSKSARCLFNPIIDFSPPALVILLKKKNSLQQPMVTLDHKQP